MEQNELNIILSYIDESIERLFKKYLAKPDPNDDEITQRQAFKEFGTKRVTNWVSLGLVTPFRAGKHKNSPKVYYRSQLTALMNGGLI